MQIVAEITHDYKPGAKPGDLPDAMRAYVLRLSEDGSGYLACIAVAYHQPGDHYHIYDIAKGGPPVRFATRGGALRELNRRIGL